jgi:hypothetical protein
MYIFEYISLFIRYRRDVIGSLDCTVAAAKIVSVGG